MACEPETQTANIEAPSARDPNAFDVVLKQKFADYIRDRAAAFGHTPETEIALVVGLYATHHDEWNRTRAKGAARPGAPTVAA